MTDSSGRFTASASGFSHHLFYGNDWKPMTDWMMVEHTEKSETQFL